MVHLWLPVIVTSLILCVLTAIAIYVTRKYCHWTKEDNKKSLDTEEYLAWHRSIHRLASDIVLEDMSSRRVHGHAPAVQSTHTLPYIIEDGYDQQLKSQQDNALQHNISAHPIDSIEDEPKGRAPGKVRFQSVEEKSSKCHDVIDI